VEGNPDGAGEVRLPGVRAHHPAAGAVPPDAARLGRPQPAGDGPVREVSASTSRSTARPSATPARASSSASRRSPTRSAPAPPRWPRCTR
jgi:hypothetical protein